MNKLLLHSALFILLITGLTGCSKTASDVSSTFSSGNWQITYMNDGGKDKTTDLVGYVYTFTNNVVSATKSGSTITGTYAQVKDSGIDKFILNFGSNKPHEELNEDWEVSEITSTKIRLQHLSGGGGGTELVT